MNTGLLTFYTLASALALTVIIWLVIITRKVS